MSSTPSTANAKSRKPRGSAASTASVDTPAAAPAVEIVSEPVVVATPSPETAATTEATSASAAVDATAAPPASPQSVLLTSLEELVDIKKAMDATIAQSQVTFTEVRKLMQQLESKVKKLQVAAKRNSKSPAAAKATRRAKATKPAADVVVSEPAGGEKNVDMVVA